MAYTKPITVIDNVTPEGSRHFVGQFEGFVGAHTGLPNGNILYDANINLAGGGKLKLTGLASFKDGIAKILMEPKFARIKLLGGGKYLLAYEYIDSERKLGLYSSDGELLFNDEYDDFKLSKDGKTLIGLKIDKGWFVFDEKFKPARYAIPISLDLQNDYDQPEFRLNESPFKINIFYKELIDCWTLQVLTSDGNEFKQIFEFDNGDEFEEDIKPLWTNGNYFIIGSVGTPRKLGNVGSGKCYFLKSDGTELKNETVLAALGIPRTEKTSIASDGNYIYFFNPKSSNRVECIKVDFSTVLKSLEIIDAGIVKIDEQKYMLTAGNRFFDEKTKGIISLSELNKLGLTRIDSETTDDLTIDGKKFKKNLLKIK